MLEQVFDNYKKIYQNILDSFYPSLGSTGFQERNLTVNFSKAYERTYVNDEVSSWFELQFGEKKNNHFDSIIINRSKKIIYIVEAKRYSTPDAKKNSSINDITRIEEYVKNDFNVDPRFKNYKNYKIYGIILGDVWQESNPKKDLYNSFHNKKFFNDIIPNDKYQIYNDISFNIDGCKAEYDLLSFIWEI